MVLPVVRVVGWLEVGFGGLPCGRGVSPCMDSRAGGGLFGAGFYGG